MRSVFNKKKGFERFEPNSGLRCGLVCLAFAFAFSVILVYPLGALAQTASSADTPPGSVNCKFTAGSGLFDINSTSVFTRGENTDCIRLLAEYIVAVNEFFLRLAIVLAVLMITIGGFQWLMAIGNSSKISNAKETIQQAVIGLILAFTATLLFSLIDRSFTELDVSTFQINKLESIANCSQYSVDTYTRQAQQDLGIDVINATVLGEAAELAQRACDAQAPLCSWNSEKKVCMSVAPGTHCSAYRNGCQNSGPVNEMLTCVTREATAAGVALGEITTHQGSHSEGSCHFGGTSCHDGSHAIDFGNEDAASTIIGFVSACRTERQLTDAQCYCEDAQGNRRNAQGQPYECSDGAVNHIHCNIQTSGCGCN